MFRIGAFSKIAHVSIHMLRHYDHIGLLAPDSIDSQTGYRYYSVRQLPRVNRILALKGLGFTLDQVARMLEHPPSGDELRGMLKLKEAQIEQQMAGDRLRLQRVKARLDQIALEGAQPQYEVVVKDIAAQPYLSSGKATWQDAALRAYAQTLYKALKQRKLHTSGCCHVVVHEPPLNEFEHNVEIGYPVLAGAPQSLALDANLTAHQRTLPAVSHMASIAFDRPRSEISIGYGAIGSWMEANGFVVGGHFRQVYLHPGQTEFDVENVVELQIPIEPHP